MPAQTVFQKRLLLNVTLFMPIFNWLSIPIVLTIAGMYYGVTICIVSLATAMTVFTLNLHHKGQRGNSVSPLAKKIVLGFLARVLCMPTKPFDSISDHTDRQCRVSVIYSAECARLSTVEIRLGIRTAG
jgi:hypothetical protein